MLVGRDCGSVGSINHLAHSLDQPVRQPAFSLWLKLPRKKLLVNSNYFYNTLAMA